MAARDARLRAVRLRRRPVQSTLLDRHGQTVLVESAACPDDLIGTVCQDALGRVRVAISPRVVTLNVAALAAHVLSHLPEGAGPVPFGYCARDCPGVPREVDLSGLVRPLDRLLDEFRGLQARIMAAVAAQRASQERRAAERHVCDARRLAVDLSSADQPAPERDHRSAG